MKFENINYDGFISKGNFTAVSLVALDSGSLIIKDSVFQNISISKRSLISVIPISASAIITTSLPQVSLENVQFEKIYMYTDDTTIDENYYSNVLTYEHSLATRFFSLKSIVYSVLPTALYVKNSTFKSIFGSSIFLTSYRQKGLILISPLKLIR